jgi:hypothetical protein
LLYYYQSLKVREIAALIKCAAGHGIDASGPGPGQAEGTPEGMVAGMTAMKRSLDRSLSGVEFRPALRHRVLEAAGIEKKRSVRMQRKMSARWCSRWWRR